MSAFARLHPRLRHGIAHDLGWRSLRPVQEEAAAAILAGHNAVILAPTAGGKTEASLFPVLSQILDAGQAPVAALYLCPIRALLNNQERRLQQLTGMVGLDVFKWHGDVAASQKRAFVAQPTHLLMTTPESLEVMLMSERVDAARLFAGLHAVVIDEVHAFAGDDRGAHLAALLERLTRFCGRDLQRIGLSATVGNPAEIGRWLQGSSGRPQALVDPPRGPAARTLRIELCADAGAVASTLQAALQGTKSLVFVESRKQAEATAQDLGAAPALDVFVHHSAVARADRERAEAMFQGEAPAAIVCTSTMELGIDVGDLDRVMQVGAPARVAAFLQRMGRTGRRPGTTSNYTCLCTSDGDLVRALAVFRLAAQGFVEDVEPPRRAVHVLAHQVMALILQEGGISRHRVLDWLAPAAPFAGIGPVELHALVDTMLHRDILCEVDGRLLLGAVGEKVYGARNFFDLYAVFSAPSMVQVLYGAAEVGVVDSAFVRGHDPSDGPLCFRLGGRSWEVQRFEARAGRVHVAPAPAGKAPAWLGQPLLLGFALCRAIKDVLAAPDTAEAAWLSPAAAHALAALRADHDGLVEPGNNALERTAEGLTWHTFAGGRANRALALALAATGSHPWRAGNLGLSAKGLGLAEGLAAIRGLAPEALPSAMAQGAAGFARGELSKFQRCLPPAAEAALLVERLLDGVGAAQVLGEGVVVVA